MANKYLFSLLAASSLALAGCTMAPDYNRPELPVPAQWPQGQPYQAGGGAAFAVAGTEAGQASAENLGWRDFFTSPHLQNLIGAALENNRDLRIAALNVEAARAMYRIQRADLVPGLNASGSGNRQGIPENASPTGSDTISSTYTAGVGVSAFELDLFGRVRSMNNSALEKFFATQEARDAAQIALVAEVANAYLAYQADRKLLDLTNNTLAAQQESYDVVNRSYELGVASRQDVAQAATLVETARANRAQYIRRLAQTKNALVLLVGADIDDALLSGEGLDSIAIREDLPVGLPSFVLLERPDIMAAEHRLKSANADIGAARAAFFPRIALTGTAGFASASLSDLFASGSALAWSFVPQITMPIFEGGRNVASLDGANARQKIAVAEYEKAIQTAFREVADELAARGTYADQLRAQRALAAASLENYTISQARYKQGIDSHLAVLDAQRSLYAAQQGEIAIHQQQLANLVTLYKVLGGGRK
ncbi:MAG: efflux transporter outer membrane subunit [Micavibrio sp.]